MAFRRVQDKLENRTSRNFSTFLGFDYGIGSTDQADDFAYVSDFQFTNNKPWLRDGCAKGQETGFSASVASLIRVTVGQGNLVGVVSGGTLDVFPVEDIEYGVRRFYTIKEVADGFTLEELKEKTWGSLLTGNE